MFTRTFPLLALTGLLASAPFLGAQGRGVPRGPSAQGQARGLPNLPANPDANRPDSAGGPVVSAGLRGPGEIADQLDRSPRLHARLAEILGVTELTTEPEGFRNLGQFVAAVQVSRNLDGVEFDPLKARMLGDEATEQEPLSLGDAIQAETALSAEEAAQAAQEAEQEAQELIEESS